MQLFFKLKSFFRICYNSIDDLISHDGIEHAGYLTFIILLAIFPFLVLMISLAGFIGELNISQTFIETFTNNLPEQIQKFMKPRIGEILSGPTQSIVSISLLGAIWTASSSFEGLRTILNRAFRVYAPPAYIFRRLLSILQFLIFVATLMFITFVLVFVLPLIDDYYTYLGIELRIQPHIIFIRDTLIFLVLLVGVCCIYYFLPNTKQKLAEVLPGALFVTFLWSASGNLLSLYISHFRQVNLIYGSLEGIIITLLFFYINNIILIFGAEFNYHLSNFRKQQIK